VVRRIGVRSRTVTAIAGVLALLAAGAALALAVSAGAAPLGSLDDTTAPIVTEPAPDPAPTPKPAPKPKPAAKTTPSTPKRTYSAPQRTYSAPTYTPPPAPTATKRPAVRKAKKHKKTAKPAVATTVPAETTPLPSVLVPVPLGARSTASQGNSEGVLSGVLFVAGVSFAALLFLLAATVPGTAVRFTPVGRVVIDHQQDFVLVGLAAFLISIFVYVLTGHGL
jgi:hypothetical protein